MDSPPIGSWGPDIVFEVSGIRVHTFNSISRKSSGRWSEHLPINTAPISEFLGPGIDECEIKMTITRMLGVDPRTEYDMIREYVRTGQYFPLILGGIPVSDIEWYADNISSSSEVFAPGTGDMLRAEMTVLLKEYN